jgi:hypothetical protein
MDQSDLRLVRVQVQKQAQITLKTRYFKRWRVEEERKKKREEGGREREGESLGGNRSVRGRDLAERLLLWCWVLPLASTIPQRFRKISN